MITTQNSEITLETLPPMRVACLRVISPSPEQDGRDALDQWIAANAPGNSSRKFGFDIEVSPDQAKEGLRGYEVWETIPDSIQALGGVTIRDFPGGFYAVMTLDRCFEDAFKRIPDGWKDLHNWVIQSKDYQSGGHQWLEEVLKTEYGETLKLYHPVMSAT